jgi:hypothetical protein
MLAPRQVAQGTLPQGNGRFIRRRPPASLS